MNPRLLFPLLLASATLAEDPPSQRVGQPLEIREVYIPGSEVKPKPRRDRTPPLMVRVLEVKPAKDGFRYDFEVQGLEPGRHNLADFLEVPEGTELPAIPLEITSGLPPGLVDPHDEGTAELPSLGGYRTKMMILAGAWFAGFVAILAWRKKKPSGEFSDSPPAPTLVERLRPLVAAASKGELSSDDRARLERLLIGHWRELRPDIAALPPAEALTRLRTDQEASPLILSLERWLHAPADSAPHPREIEQLLAPYT